jgi:sugar lactone lactonase YvrE
MLHNVQVVGAYNDLCGECPVWDAGDSALYWTDCSGRRFHRLDPDSGIHSEVATSRAINGFRLNEPGGFVVSSGDGIWQWSGDEEFSLLCSQVQGAKCQMNDCVADPFGGLIAGSQFYDSSGCYEMGKLMRVRPHGRPEILDEGFHLSNGLAFSPDCKTLYFADSVGRHIYSYDFDLGTGSVSRRRTFVKVPDTDGLPDVRQLHRPLRS